MGWSNGKKLGCGAGLNISPLVCSFFSPYWSALRAQDLAATSPQVLAAEQQLPQVPLLVLSAEEPSDDRSRQVWTDVNVGIAALVPGGVHRVVPGSDHMSLALARADAQVTTASILEVLVAAGTD